MNTPNPPSLAPAAAPRTSVRQHTRAVLREAGIGVALVALVGVFALLSPIFLTANNITNIFTQISINVILAVGMTFVILIGGIDLSVGSVMAFCAVVAGTVLKLEGLDTGVAIALAAETPTPAEAREPGARLGGGRSGAIVQELSRWMVPRRPVVEPPDRAARIERGRVARGRDRSIVAAAAARRVVLAVVEEDVDERVADFARRLQLVAVMAVAKERSVPTRNGIYGERDAREQRAHLARKVRAALAFDHEMQVIVLN
jgi:hypothetical protein